MIEVMWRWGQPIDEESFPKLSEEARASLRKIGALLSEGRCPCGGRLSAIEIEDDSIRVSGSCSKCGKWWVLRDPTEDNSTAFAWSLEGEPDWTGARAARLYRELGESGLL